MFLFREVFRTHGWSFYAQNIKANRVELFSQQDAIIDLGMGYKYASVIVKLNTFFYLHPFYHYWHQFNKNSLAAEAFAF